MKNIVLAHSARARILDRKHVSRETRTESFGARANKKSGRMNSKIGNYEHRHSTSTTVRSYNFQSMKGYILWVTLS